MYNSTFKQKSLEAIKASQQEKKDKKLQSIKLAVNSSPRAKKVVKKTIKKVKEKSVKSIETKLWQLCRELANILYVKEDGNYYCYTCDKQVEGANKQLGHFLPKGSCPADLKYEMKNLRWQCWFCNIRMGGNGAEFMKRLIRDEGQLYVDELFERKYKGTMGKSRDIYTQLIEEITSKLKA